MGFQTPLSFSQSTYTPTRILNMISDKLADYVIAILTALVLREYRS